MVNPIETIGLYCPWCDAPLSMDIDVSGGAQTYVEDCQVCCSPMVVEVSMDMGRDAGLQVALRREGD